MPHDRNGKPLQEGDEVTMHLRVTAVYAGETVCNVSLQALDVAKTGEYTPFLSCNSRLVEPAQPAQPVE